MSKLIISDTFLLQEMIRYKLLHNNHAFNLVLRQISDEKKLDAISFAKLFNFKRHKNNCSLYGPNLYLCKGKDGLFTAITKLQSSGYNLGYIISAKHYRLIATPIYYGVGSILFIVGVAFFLNFVMLFIFVSKKIKSNIQSLLNFISVNENNKDVTLFTIEECAQLARIYLDKKKEICALEQERQYNAAIQDLARQVVHDIKSPLAAIRTAIVNLNDIPECNRIMLKKASERLEDLANNLLGADKKALLGSSGFTSEGEKSSELLFVAVAQILSEKRFEYAHRDVVFHLEVQENQMQMFSVINVIIFKRVISNLINNAVEAISNSGTVVLSLLTEKDCHVINIKDNGCGISPNILMKIGEKGFTYNKQGGQGLGYYDANNQIKSMGGKIEICSTVGVGTDIKISLPKAKLPAWYCSQIRVDEYNKIAILDDDESIHYAWQDRFSHLNVTLSHYYLAADFLATHNVNDFDLYLIDYDLLGGDKNGIAVMDCLSSASPKMLVTSASDDRFLREQCVSKNIKILPKECVPYIRPILLAQQDLCSKYILIDDDPLIRAAWQLTADQVGVHLHCFSSYQDFQSNISVFDRTEVVCIDSFLSGSKRGEFFAAEIRASGFKHIVLTTGASVDLLENLEGIDVVIGKQPPFLKQGDFK